MFKLKLINYKLIKTYSKHNKHKKNNINDFLLKVKVMIILSFLFFFVKIKVEIFLNYKQNNLFRIISKKEKNNYKKNENSTYMYFSCLVAVGKKENRYIREFIQHYKSIGFEKIYLGDDNDLKTEKLIDVLKDYINEGFIEIIDIRGKNISQEDFYEFTFKYANLKCNWLLFCDIDEYLVFKNNSMTIKSYLSKGEFNKCDVVKIHWLMYYDNDLVYYDNRTLNERFTKPNYISFNNNFHKSILKGKMYNQKLWDYRTGPHQPNESLVNMCDAVGNLDNNRHGILALPNYKYCYIKHFRTKTAEEFAYKILRGTDLGEKFDINQKINYFFAYNKLTKEKLEIFERILNRTFPKYHYIIKKKKNYLMK